MAEVKDKAVTVESLSTLHEYNEKAYMLKENPVGNGEMTVTGNANFSGSVNVGSLMIGSSVQLVPVGDALEIVFLEDETTE